jgi:hypothetical protein
MPSHTDTLSDRIPYRRAGRRSVRHGARLASIYGKRGYILAQCALGEKACSEHPVAQSRNRTPQTCRNAQGVTREAAHTRSNALEAEAWSPTTGTIPSWWARQRHASGVAWSRLTRGDSSRIGLRTSGRRCASCAFSSRSSRGFRRRDRDRGHAHNKLYAAAAVRRDRTNGACCCAGHGRICTDTQRPAVCRHAAGYGCWQVSTSAQGPRACMRCMRACVYAYSCEHARAHVVTCALRARLRVRA